MRKALAFLLVLACLGAAAERKPVRLFAEGEDFLAKEGGWRLVPYRENYYAATFAVTFLSRMACLGAPAQCEQVEAVQTVRIPYADAYQVFARYEQPYRFSCEFTVVVEQGGREVYRETFGRLDDPKIWAFNNHQRVPMARYAWGGTDNIVWQQRGAASLEAGEATLRLLAGPQMDGAEPRRMAAERHVDVLCLTNDAAGLETQRRKARYLELDGWLTLGGDLFVRFTNPPDGLGPCVPIVAPHARGQHSPYWVHVRDWPTTRVLTSGRITTPTSYQIAGPHAVPASAEGLAPELDPGDFKTIPEDQYLAPGERSGWVPLGPVCDALNDYVWLPRAEYKGRKGKELDLVVEFGVPSRGGGIEAIRKVRAKGTPGTISPVSFVIPADLLRQRSAEGAEPSLLVRTQLEWLEWLAGEVGKFPDRPAPERFPIYGLMGFSGAMRQEGEIGRVATRLALALGSNTLTHLDTPWAERLGVPRRRTACVTHWRPGTLEQMAQRCERAEQKGQLDQIAIVSFGDEIHIPPAKADNAKFAAWLKKRGVHYDGEVKFTDRREDPLYYYSRLWAIEAGIAHYAQHTRLLEERIGPHVRTGANYSPHANYLVTDLQWVRPFKLRGMTLPWSEDYVWGVPEPSVQVTGYLVSAFRCGAKYRGLPILMYVMPHTPGNTPRDFRLSFYTAVAHGAKAVHYFCAVPLAVGYTENHIETDDLAMWRAVYEATHDAAVFEDYVLDGTVRQAKVALLLSSVDEILGGYTNFKGGVHNAERKALYLALRHAQVPVDFLTEDDVIEGRARDYVLIYVTQEYLHSKAIGALTEWVEAGGTLVACCGGGLWNELGQKNPQAEALYGAKGYEITKAPDLAQILPKQDLPPAKPLAAATIGTRDRPVAEGVPVIAWQQKLEPAGGDVHGTFSTGGAAVVSKQHGKGDAVLFGFLPGLAWLRSGLPLRPVDRGSTNEAYAHFLPTAFDGRLHAAIVGRFPEARWWADRPVLCSEPLVETTCIDTTEPPRLAVPLMNYTGKPIARLTVTVCDLPSARRVRSVQRGALSPRFREGAMVVELPLEVADMLLIDR
ncbi:MAG: hypothetical protein ACLF0G_02665 [Candidatus Brocadiia bacterium]